MIGLIGILVFFAGLHLLWQARDAIRYWFETFFQIFRGALRQRAAVPAADLPRRPERAPDTLRLVGGVGLAVLGQLLLILEIAIRLSGVKLFD